MSDHHHAGPAPDDVYDHEHEEPRSGRRRRPVADWGVGEDMFEHMPRKRLPRTTEASPRERRGAREDGERRPPRTADGTSPGRESAPAESTPRGGVDDGRRTIRIGKDEDVPSEIAAITADRDLGSDEPPAGAGAPRATERRTVKIGGRP